MHVCARACVFVRACVCGVVVITAAAPTQFGQPWRGRTVTLNVRWPPAHPSPPPPDTQQPLLTQRNTHTHADTRRHTRCGTGVRVRPALTGPSMRSVASKHLGALAALRLSRAAVCQPPRWNRGGGEGGFLMVSHVTGAEWQRWQTTHTLEQSHAAAAANVDN